MLQCIERTHACVITQCQPEACCSIWCCTSQNAARKDSTRVCLWVWVCWRSIGFGCIRFLAVDSGVQSSNPNLPTFGFYANSPVDLIFKILQTPRLRKLLILRPVSETPNHKLETLCKYLGSRQIRAERHGRSSVEAQSLLVLGCRVQAPSAKPSVAFMFGSRSFCDLA